MCPVVTAQAPLPASLPQQSTENVTHAGQTPAAVEATPKPSVDPLAAREAEFARREKALRQSAIALKAEKESLTSSTAQKISDYEKSFHKSLADDFWGTAIKAGLSPDQIVERLTNRPTAESTQLTQFQLKLQALEEQNKRLENQTKDSETRAYDQAKSLIRKEVSMLVGEGETFEAIKAMNSEDAVVELIDSVLNEEGYMMSVEDAAQEVENYLTDEILKFNKLKKIQSKLSPPETAPQQRQIPGKQPSQTISNRAVQNATNPKLFTPKERIERAKRIAAGLAVD